jgi:hypothetical protein
VRYTDPDGNYDRKAAVAYAHTWNTSRNRQYHSYTVTDCANFVSQSLFAGGMRETDNWYSRRSIRVLNPGIPSTSGFEYNVAPAWRLVDDLYAMLTNPENGYINGDVLKISSAEEMNAAVLTRAVQIGDVMFFAGQDGNDPHHAAIITKIDEGKIFFSAHTNNQDDRELTSYLNKEAVLIIRIRDEAL